MSDNEHYDDFDKSNQIITNQIVLSIKNYIPKKYHDDIPIDEISEHINEYKTELTNDFEISSRELIKQLRDTQASVTRLLDNHEQTLDKNKIYRERTNRAIRSVSVLRIFLNQELNNLWDTNTSDLHYLTDDQLVNFANNVSCLKRPDRVTSHNGLKLAVCVLNDQSTLIEKALAEFYIRLNNRHHPIVQPARDIVNSSIDNLETLISNHELPTNYEQMGITKENLELVRNRIR